jgi:hypothetical protein
MAKTKETSGKKTQKKNSPNHILGVQLVSGNLNDNFKRLKSLLEIKEDAEIEALVPRFRMISNLGILDTTVDENKRKSAVIFLALAMRYGTDTFTLNRSDVALIMAYYTYEQVKDAENNPETSHTSIQHALLGKSVTITIYRDLPSLP